MTDTLSHYPVPAGVGSEVARALQEDVGEGDATALLVPQDQQVRGQVVTREDAVLCGAPWAAETFRQLDREIKIAWRAVDGDLVQAGAILFTVEGPARPILTGERTALNFLQLLSGVATSTRGFTEAVKGTGCTILDTRKTLPGLRAAQKYAVRCGGARNHRMGLYDMVLIKENHIASAGSISAAVAAAHRSSRQLQVEVEVESLKEFEEALAAEPDRILLDDFDISALETAVERVRASGAAVKLEASGSARLETVRAIAATGVDFISVGALTKHVRAVDLSMRLAFATPQPT